MVKEVRRDVVKIGMDFRPIPVDLGDGIEWEFHPDPSAEQWSSLVTALQGFTGLKDDDNFGSENFTTALSGLTAAMANLLVKDDQRELWLEKQYGIGPQQAISNALMELWTGFPTNQPSPSGGASKKTG